MTTGTQKKMSTTVPTLNSTICIGVKISMTVEMAKKNTEENNLNEVFSFLGEFSEERFDKLFEEAKNEICFVNFKNEKND